MAKSRHGIPGKSRRVSEKERNLAIARVNRNDFLTAACNFGISESEDIDHYRDKCRHSKGKK